MRGRATATKGAELASGLGAIVLGAGLALVHGVGMTLKYKLENRDGLPLWWEQALLWLCWACLAALGLWIALFPAAR